MFQLAPPGSRLPPRSRALVHPSFSDSCLLSHPQDLATPQAFARNPSLVWEFYHYRREVMLSKEPNPGHLAIAECEARLRGQGRRLVVITQNIDELHRKAGTKNLLEIHGEVPSRGEGNQTSKHVSCHFPPGPTEPQSAFRQDTQASGVWVTRQRRECPGRLAGKGKCGPSNNLRLWQEPPGKTLAFLGVAVSFPLLPSWPVP